ncbi:Hypothetical protein Minf_2069 [Methylacidiphilum infernorum V4]|uniref:Uncharacterized protein n=1 Tax=Methylacidiphilum infernorum (isolate V4) TaxID=481448 RepID=B3DZ31_METI4|nr:Hypothetical protein Minf_2069 [Methylacidiphilum infernorum V4]
MGKRKRPVLLILHLDRNFSFSLSLTEFLFIVDEIEGHFYRLAGSKNKRQKGHK